MKERPRKVKWLRSGSRGKGLTLSLGWALVLGPGFSRQGAVVLQAGQRPKGFQQNSEHLQSLGIKDSLSSAFLLAF